MSVHHILSYSEKYGASSITKELEQLPGVGPYTARAVAAFAFNADVVFVETNIRTAIMYHFSLRFAGVPSARSARVARPILHLAKSTSAPLVSDQEILEILGTLLPKRKAREWYSALMDYGAQLKRSGVRVNARSATYTKQSKFDGSLRQARGAVLAALTAHKSLARIRKAYPDRFEEAVSMLVRDGLIRRRGRGITLAR